ncbi:MAG TPA: hypothetical protein PJ982_08175 [Lacipirellulaceae bacterium]|nr:hypothetical protein [Lacipirellulaceae bacterium]
MPRIVPLLLTPIVLAHSLACCAAGPLGHHPELHAASACGHAGPHGHVAAPGHCSRGPALARHDALPGDAHHCSHDYCQWGVDRVAAPPLAWSPIPAATPAPLAEAAACPAVRLLSHAAGPPGDRPSLRRHLALGVLLV